MFGIIAGLGLVGYALHNKKKTNNYQIAKYIEHSIDIGKPFYGEIEGFYSKEEVIRIMAEDGYNYYKYYE